MKIPRQSMNYLTSAPGVTRPFLGASLAILLVVSVLSGCKGSGQNTPNFAGVKDGGLGLVQCQAPSPNSLEGGNKPDEIQPAPPSIGADVPLTYFGPSPSSVKPELVGPVQLLKAGKLDVDAATITLPLYQGKMADGRLVWYILTDTTDKQNADALGLNFSAKLEYADQSSKAVRHATQDKDGILTFAQGTVDFSLALSVVPGDLPKAFPPKSFQPGAEGDSDYSPLVRIDNAGGHIYNAPIVAFDVDAAAISFCNGSPDYNKVHDKVVKICPADPARGPGPAVVTLKLNPGFSFSKPILYLSMDANDPMVAAIEGITLAPGLKQIGVGRDDSAFSAVERIFGFSNGPTNPSGTEVNPQRQGLTSALLKQGGPLNVLGGIPTVATDYSPLWDLNLGEWTQDAISKGYRSRLTEEFAILGFVAKGWITGPSGTKFGSTGVIINCPIVHRFL